MRTKKIRGEESLLNSISIAEREEGPGIADVIRCGERLFAHQYGTAGPRKKIRYAPIRGVQGNLRLKPDLD